jgi:hypothetical protein
MAEINPPWTLEQLATHHANVNRMFMAASTGRVEGVIYGLAVAQRGAGANMSVDIAKGSGVVFGDDNEQQGTYGVTNDATANVVIAAADPTNPRRDLIACRVRDAFYTGGTNAWDLFVIQGTAAGAPVDPTVPNNCMVLARVAVAAAASSITNANITDLRSFTPVGVQMVNSARPPGTLYGGYSQEPAFKPVPAAGLTIFEQDTFKLKCYTTATTGFQSPWNVPWGIVDYVTNTTGQTSINGVTDLTGLTSTKTYVANRNIKISALIPQGDASGSACIWLLYIMEGATQLGRVQATAPAGAQPQAPFAQVVISPTSGSHTYKLQGQTGAATGRYTASATQPAIFLIEDIGPSANPA